MNLILLDNNDKVGDNLYSLSDERAEHIRNIINPSVGDHLQVGLINGGTGSGTVTAIDNDVVKLSVELNQEMPLPPVDIDLICALPRPQTVKKILRLCGMMSIRRLFLIRANRVEKSFYDSPLLTDQKMRPLLLEGLAQGRFTRLTEVTIERQFRPFVEDRLGQLYEDNNRPVRILPEQSAIDNLYSVLARSKGFPNEIVLAIGPEGGWVDFEIDLLVKHDFRTFSIGPWTLRVEDAVTASLAQIEQCRRVIF